ncbi:Ubiquitin--protein ligase [Bertholletia excelsa]
MELDHKNPDQDPSPSSMDYPQDFKCPISMEVMKDPVTISTGVSYERKNIEKWFFTYKKTTCPATMQKIHSFDMTPNHTLFRLIRSWQNRFEQPSSPSPPLSPLSDRHDDLVSLLAAIESTPFKVGALKKLQSVLAAGDDTRADFRRSGGVEALVRIITQVLEEMSDFVAFRASEEALSVLHHLPLSSDHDIDLFSTSDAVKSLATILRRGSSDARFHAISTLQKIPKSDQTLNSLLQHQPVDLFKSILELISDNIHTKASSCALHLLVEILGGSKKSRFRAVEAGAVCVLVELLPESSRAKTEKIMRVIKMLCECAEGRLALVEHRLGLAAVTEKMLGMSVAAMRMGVKIVWLVCSSHPPEKVVEEMLVAGTVRALVALVHMDGGIGGGSGSSTKERALKILKLHGSAWRRYPCFPVELRQHLGFCDGVSK